MTNVTSAIETQRPFWSAFESLVSNVGNLELTITTLEKRLSPIYSLPNNDIAQENAESLMLSAQIYSISRRVGACRDSINNIIELVEV